MEAYRLIPLETYPRRAHFAYFSQMAQPYAGLTAPVEITAFLKKLRQEGSPFFLSFLYCVWRTAPIATASRTGGGPLRVICPGPSGSRRQPGSGGV